jgi:hypothetical protein
LRRCGRQFSEAAVKIVFRVQDGGDERSILGLATSRKGRGSLSRRGQHTIKDCTAPCAALSPYLTAVRLHDGPAD